MAMYSFFTEHQLHKVCLRRRRVTPRLLHLCSGWSHHSGRSTVWKFRMNQFVLEEFLFPAEWKRRPPQSEIAGRWKSKELIPKSLKSLKAAGCVQTFERATFSVHLSPAGKTFKLKASELIMNVNEAKIRQNDDINRKWKWSWTNRFVLCELVS